MGSIDPSILHSPHMAKCLTREERKKAGILTREESAEKAKAGEELKLQGEIAQYLLLHDICYDKPDGRKKSKRRKGWPDFVFAYRGVPMGLECKTEDGELREDQIKVHAHLRRNGWIIVMPQSVADVQRAFREIDQQKEKL